MLPIRLRSTSFSGIKKKLGYLKPIAFAKKIGVVIRKPKKIIITNLLMSYWLLTSKGKFSYDDWAMELSMLQKETVSSQAIWKRIDSDMVVYLEGVIGKVIASKM